ACRWKDSGTWELRATMGSRLGRPLRGREDAAVTVARRGPCEVGAGLLATSGDAGETLSREAPAAVNASEVQLRPQLQDFRLHVVAAAAGIGADVVGLELQVAAEVPVGAQRPVRLAAA